MAPKPGRMRCRTCDSVDRRSGHFTANRSDSANCGRCGSTSTSGALPDPRHHETRERTTRWEACPLASRDPPSLAAVAYCGFPHFLTRARLALLQTIQSQSPAVPPTEELLQQGFRGRPSKLRSGWKVHLEAIPTHFGSVQRGGVASSLQRFARVCSVAWVSPGDYVDAEVLPPPPMDPPTMAA